MDQDNQKRGNICIRMITNMLPLTKTLHQMALPDRVLLLPLISSLPFGRLYIHYLSSSCWEAKFIGNLGLIIPPSRFLHPVTSRSFDKPPCYLIGCRAKTGSTITTSGKPSKPELAFSQLPNKEAAKTSKIRFPRKIRFYLKKVREMSLTFITNLTKRDKTVLKPLLQA